MLKDYHNQQDFSSGVMQDIYNSRSGGRSSSSDTRLRTQTRDYVINDDVEVEDVEQINENSLKNSLLSPYLILSPSSPIRIFAITFLSHWIYPSVIFLTIGAFVLSSVYSYYTYIDEGYRESVADKGGDLNNNHNANEEVRLNWLEDDSGGDFGVLDAVRWIMLIVLILEVFIKSIARGFLVAGELAYLRIPWDWLDIFSLILTFISIITPWKSVKFVAAAFLLVKLIPLFPGSINAFIFVCSCANKLIPVFLYGIIIVWLYGLVIFTLFVKHREDELQEASFVHDDDPRKGDSHSKSNGSSSTSDILNESIQRLGEREYVADSSPDGDVQGDLVSSEREKFQNLSFQMTMECLPANFRSLSGALLQVIKMLTLQYHLPKETTNESFGSTIEISCQVETYTLFVIETLVIISGTLPMISMTFSALVNIFQNRKSNFVKEAQNSMHQQYQNSHSHHNALLNRSESGESERSCSQRHDKDCQDTSTSSPCFSNSFKKVANTLCDCDYYFCCLASLQRKIGPCASSLLNSNKFKVLVFLVISTDFLSMILLLCFIDSSDSVIDFPKLTDTSTSTWLIINYVKICFMLYTLEALFKWFVLSSDEYWINVWSAFDLIIALIYWIGYSVIHIKFHGKFDPLYARFCGILMIRMLKIVPHWQSLYESLKYTWSSVLDNRHNLFVILICSFSAVLLKNAAFMLEAQWTTQTSTLDLNPSFYIMIDSLFRLIIYIFCAIIIVAVYFHVYEKLRTPPEPADGSTYSNPQISLLLNNRHRDSQFSEMTIMSDSTHHLPRPSLNDSSSPISVMDEVTNSLHIQNLNPHQQYRNKDRLTLSSSLCASNSNSGLLLTPEITRSIMSPRTSDALSPLLAVPSPSPNGLNGHVYHLNDNDQHHTNLSDENIQSGFHNNNASDIFSFNRNRTSIDNRRKTFFASLCASMEDVFNLTSTAVIILATINLALSMPENGGNRMTWRSLYLGRSLWLEVVFIMCLTMHIVYKTRLVKFPRETFLQISTLVDLIIILAAAAEVYSFGMRWVPVQQNGSRKGNTFLQCAKILSSCRCLLLISRISWLQCVGSGLCYLIWKLSKYLLSFGYLWIIFVLSSLEIQNALKSPHYYNDNETLFQKVSSPITGNGTENVTNPKNISFPAKLISRNVEEFSLHPILCFLLIFLMLLSSGILLAILHHKLQDMTKLFEKFMTPNQVATHISRSWRNHQNRPVPESVKPTEGTCVPILYYVSNHPTFDAIIMVIILLDGFGITFEHFATSERALVLREHYPAYMLFLYGIELISKFGGNSLKFFSSYWNIFDCLIVLISLINFFIYFVYQNWISLLLQNIRFLRVLRIFQFAPFVKRTTIIQGLLFSIQKTLFALGNFSMFYFCLFIAIIVLHGRRIHNEQEDEDYESSSVYSTLSSTFLSTISLQNIFQCLGTHCLSHSSFSYIFYKFELGTIYLLKFSVVFSACLLIIIVVCQYLYKRNETCRPDISKSISMSMSQPHPNNQNHNHDDDDDLHRLRLPQNEDGEEKYSHLLPCMTPDTSNDVETPTSSASAGGACSRIMNMNPTTSSSLKLLDAGSGGGVLISEDNNTNTTTDLYNTTTFTSTREINGCKVFFVEAMITTV